MANSNDEKGEEDEDEDEEEEEEIIVYANFEEGTVEKEIFQQPDLKFKVIGLDSATPIVQLGDTIFKGVWKDTIGTKVFFEEDLSPEPVDPVFTLNPPKMLKYKCMSTKALELSRIFLKPKNANSSATVSDEAGENAEKGGDSNQDIVEKDDEQNVLDLAQCTISPDPITKAIMSHIVTQSTVDVLENISEINDN